MRGGLARSSDEVSENSWSEGVELLVLLIESTKREELSETDKTILYFQAKHYGGLGESESK